MTRTPEILGPEYDAPARFPDGTEYYTPKGDLAAEGLRRAEEAGDADIVELMQWELAILNVLLAPAEGVSPYHGTPYEQFAERYKLTPETEVYARERAAETQDLILRLHYLQYALLRMAPKGRAWIDVQRELLSGYREYVDGCAIAAADDVEGHAGLHIWRALVAVGPLLRRPGVVRDGEAAAWSEWLVELARRSLSFHTPDPNWREQQRHRWIADFVFQLSDLPPTASSPEVRELALALLAEASAYYDSTPLNDTFSQRVAVVEASLRKHWGEDGTHEVLTRRNFATLLRRAELHRSTGSGLLTAHFFREARRLLEEQRQYFTADDVARLQKEEQAALEGAVEAKEFAEIRIPMSIPSEMMDYTRSTPEETVNALLEQVVHSVPNRAQIDVDIQSTDEEAPLHSMIPRTVLGAGKVVGESQTADGNRALDVERHALMEAQLLGAVVITTLIRASEAVNLSAKHLVAPLANLNLDTDTREFIEIACEHALKKDFVSAMHILVPHFENVLRQYLKSVGVDTTDFRRDVGDGSSRTDDATLGSLMRKSMPDGSSVRDHLGADLWDHVESVLNSQTGLNLRNNIAHGLARRHHCTPEATGIVLSLYYLVAEGANRNSGQ